MNDYHTVNDSLTAAEKVARLAELIQALPLSLSDAIRRDDMVDDLKSLSRELS